MSLDAISNREGVEAISFHDKWMQMMEYTFGVSLKKLEMEIEELKKNSGSRIRVSNLKQKGRIVTCEVDGYADQLIDIFKVGRDFKLASSHIDSKDEAVVVSSVSSGVECLRDDEWYTGKVRVTFELVSKGCLYENGANFVSFDTEREKRRLEKEGEKILELLNLYQEGKCSPIQEDFLCGRFRIRPECGLASSPHLDESQNEAYGRAMLFGEYPILFIQGPPGTGKTRTIREIIDSHIQYGRKVLVLSHSNRGKDEPARQLIEKWRGQEHKKKAESRAADNIFIAGNLPEKIDPSLRRYRIKRDHKFPEKRIRKIDRMSEAECIEKYGLHGQLLDEHALMQMKSAMKDAVVYDYKVRCRKAEEKFRECMESGGAVFSTFGSLLNDQMIANMEFDVVIVDESTRMQAPDLVMALEKAGTQIIFVGDPEQLGNIPLSPETKRELAGKLENFPLEGIIDTFRMKFGGAFSEGRSRIIADALDVFDRGPYAQAIGLCENPENELPFVFLRHGRRSLPKITQLVSEYTYGGKLVPARRANGSEGTVLWLDTKNLRVHEKTVGTSKRNPTESQIIGRRVIDALKRQGLSPSDIGVIATYASQVVALRNGIGRILRGTEEGRQILKELFPNIDSVDGFQGDQRNYVLMSFTRSNAQGNVGFTDEESRINVGISRAADHLVIVGDTSTLIDNNQDPVSRTRFETLRNLVAKLGEVKEVKFMQKRKKDRNPKKRRERRRKRREKTMVDSQ
jgi:hypothetical protein